MLLRVRFVLLEFFISFFFSGDGLLLRDLGESIG